MNEGKKTNNGKDLRKLCLFLSRKETKGKGGRKKYYVKQNENGMKSFTFLFSFSKQENTMEL